MPRFALQPPVVVVLLAIALPGVSSFLLRGCRDLRPFLLLPIIPAAFGLFGPFWGEVLFRDYPHWLREAGLWPFLLTCVLVPIYSAWLALRDLAKATRG